MFKNLKATISELAYSAVNMAEQSLDTSGGQEKKILAIEYVISMLPILPPLKKVVVILLSKFIDDAIEKAVTYMNNMKNVEG
jgi:hypothetical protein